MCLLFINYLISEIYGDHGWIQAWRETGGQTEAYCTAVQCPRRTQTDMPELWEMKHEVLSFCGKELPEGHTPVVTSMLQPYLTHAKSSDLPGCRT